MIDFLPLEWKFWKKKETNTNLQKSNQDEDTNTTIIERNNKKRKARSMASWWLLATICFSTIPILILLYSRLMLFDDSFGWNKVFETVIEDPLKKGNLLFIAISCSIAAYIDFLFSAKRKEYSTKARNFVHLTFWIIILTVGITYTMVSLFNGPDNLGVYKVNDLALRTVNAILFILSMTYAFYTKAFIFRKS